MRLLLAASMTLVAAPLWAGLDDDDKAWLEGVQPILLEEEEAALRSLASKEDRLEFRRIFWARRDPDLDTPENEFQKTYEERRTDADKRFFTGTNIPVARSTDSLGSQARASTDILANRVNAEEMAAMEEIELRQFRDMRMRDATAGANTDCGITYIVLGKPDDVQVRTQTVWGSREPQSWLYRDKNTKITFDEACMMPVGNDKLRRQLREYTVSYPLITYHVKGGELLKKLADMLPKLTPMRELLLRPRRDFEVVVEPFFLRSADGTGVLGLVRGEAGALFREGASGRAVRLIVRAEAVPVDGRRTVREREMLADIDASGAFVASFRLDAKPGLHTLKLAVLDANSSKGAVLEQPIEVPDFASGELTIAPLLALEGMEEKVKRDAKHPLADFTIGGTRLRPRFGRTFTPSDSLLVSYQFYDARIDPATQKPSAVAKIRILRDGGTAVAEAPDEPFDTPIAGTVVGPVALARYPPGAYRIQLEVTDNVARKTYTQEATFDIVAPPSLASQ